MADNLINANVVLSLIDAEIAEHYSYYSDQTLTRVRRAIEKLPGVDAVPVVRCADCIRYHPDADGVWGWCTVSTTDKKMRKKDFCSLGVRKDEDHETN